MTATPTINGFMILGVGVGDDLALLEILGKQMLYLLRVTGPLLTGRTSETVSPTAVLVYSKSFIGHVP